MSIDHFTDNTHIPSVDMATFNRAFEPYGVSHFTEAENPAGVMKAQRLRGESYVNFGLADKSVLDEDGCLPEWLDHAGGERITYYTATPRADGVDGWAAGRLIDGELESLAAYRDCKEAMYPEQGQFLLDAARDGRRIREVGALALSSDATSIASFSIIRDIVQCAIREDTGEILMGQQTPGALKGFRAMFGGTTVKQIGDGTLMHTGGDITVSLTPVYADACRTLDNLLCDIKNPRVDEKIRQRLTGSLMFLADGLYAEEMSVSVQDFFGDMGMDIQSRRGLNENQ